MNSRPFWICAAGRSRTAWFAELLTCGGWRCDHDQALYMRSVDDVVRFFAQPRHGSAESAGAPGWDLVRHLVPDIRTVVIRRPVDEVLASFLALDLRGVATFDPEPLRRNLERLSRAQDRIARQPGVLVVEYADLKHEDACSAVWRHCLPFSWDRARWESLKDRNVQCDVVEQIVYYHANRSGIEAFKVTIAREMRRLVRAGLIHRRQVHVD